LAKSIRPTAPLRLDFYIFIQINTLNDHFQLKLVFAFIGAGKSASPIPDLNWPDVLRSNNNQALSIHTMGEREIISTGAE
jgi:hypothetical protein